MKRMGGSKGLMKQINPHNKSQPVPPQQLSQLSKMIDPNMLKAAGGMGGLQKMMQQMASGGGLGAMGDMFGGLGGLGGLGGMFGGAGPSGGQGAKKGRR